MKTLAELRKKTEQTGGNRTYISLKEGEAVTIRFREELAEDSKNYDPERGTTRLVAVHRSPINFKRSMVCTSDDGGCWACEQVAVAAEGNKWRPQNHLLANVGVLDDNGKWTNAILDQGFSKSHIGDDIVDYALTHDSIVNAVFKLKREGSGLATNYSLITMDMHLGPEPEELASVPREDLSAAKYKTIAYADQEEWMTTSDDNSVASAATAKKW